MYNINTNRIFATLLIINTLKIMENRFSTADIYVDKNRNSVNLYADIWQENTTALLLSPRVVDKTATAIDIVTSLTSQGNKVFYLTTQRIAKSNLSKITGNTHLYVHSPEFIDAKDPTDFADIVIADIEEAIDSTDARIFVIDSLSRIAALSFGKNASANYVMKRLVALQVRHKISLLVLAHDTTRAANRTLINLADRQILIEQPESCESKFSAKPDKKTTAKDESKQSETAPTDNDEPKNILEYLDKKYAVIDEKGDYYTFGEWPGRKDFLRSHRFQEMLGKGAFRI